MLTKRSILMPSSSLFVKKTSHLLVAGLAVCGATISPAAFASDNIFIDRQVTVSFRLADVQTSEGTEKVYNKFVKTATSSCRSDRNTLQYLGQSVKQCADDLVEQLVKSSEIDGLIRHHREVTGQGKQIQLASASR